MSFDLSIRPKSYQEGSEREWLVTNGLGGYASSTVIAANTRSYHGLLVAALTPPTGRTLLLSSIDEELIADGVSCHLACHQYPGTIYPQGFRHLQEFQRYPVPTFLYRTEGMEVKKRVFMVYGENTTVIRYDIEGVGLFRAVPLVSCRSFHVASGAPPMDQSRLSVEGPGGGVRLRSDCDFSIVSDGARYLREDLWYHSLEYEVERRRGLQWREDAFSPGRFEAEVDGRLSFSIIASLHRSSPEGAGALLVREEDRVNRLLAAGGDPRSGVLAAGADQFLVRRGDGKSIIAGYPWFNDWGRDAMIALPGLLLTIGRFEDAGTVLATFAGAMKDGLLPNDFGAEGYNTIDAALWFFWAVYKYWSYSGDLDLVRRLFPTLRAICRRYAGETPGSYSDGDGLIASKPGLTWMDAKVGEEFVTPRAGKACEINALWYHGLKVMELFTERLGDEAVEVGVEGADEVVYPDLAERVGESYSKFWNPEEGCLYDLIDGIDPAIRPNQVIAASLPFTPLDSGQIRGIVGVATEELLTPYGLRTLSPRDPAYLGRYEGGPAERDGAYHQGTVWPWLMGPYITARLRAGGNTKKEREAAGDLLRPLIGLEGQIGVGTICEVFDGDGPHRPGGCISQAWSVGEVMRAWHEGVLGGARGPKV